MTHYLSIQQKYFLFCINAANREKDFNWLQGSILSEHDVQVTNASDDYAQANNRRFVESTLAKLTDVALDQIAYYHFATGTVGGLDECILLELVIPENRV